MNDSKDKIMNKVINGWMKKTNEEERERSCIMQTSAGLKMMSVSWHHLSNVNPQILLVVRPVADCQTQLLLLTGFVQLHLLEERTSEQSHDLKTIKISQRPAEMMKIQRLEGTTERRM